MTHVLIEAFNKKRGGSSPPRSWSGKFFKLTSKGYKFLHSFTVGIDSGVFLVAREVLKQSSENSVLKGIREAIERIWDFGDLEYKEPQDISYFYKNFLSVSEESKFTSKIREAIKLGFLKVV